MKIRRIKYCNGLDQRVARQQFVNMVQHATIEEAVFSVDPTDAPTDWLDRNRVIYVYCRSMSVPWVYKSDRIRSAAEAREQASKQ
jgi:hypothetical protein